MWKAGLYTGKAGVVFNSVLGTVVTLMMGSIGLLFQRSPICCLGQVSRKSLDRGKEAVRGMPSPKF